MAANRYSSIRSVNIGTATMHFVSGTTAGDAAPYDVAEQTRLVFARIQELLQTQGSSLKDVVKITVFLTDIREYATYNAVRNAIFADIEPPPASTAVEALLNGPGKRLEIEVIAIKPA